MINCLRKLKRYIGVKLLSKSNTDKVIEEAGVSFTKSVIYKFGSQFLIDRSFPLHLYLELSRSCNYNCPMCMHNQAGSGGHFSVEMAQKIVSEAAQYGPTSYSLHLFGEPLANPKWPIIVKMIKDAHPHNGVLLTTNGYFMNEKTCRKLIELKLDRIFVSLHTLDSEKYTKNTGGGDLSTVLSNIYNFKKIAGNASKTKLYVRLFDGPDQTPIEKENLSVIKKLNIPFEIRGYHNFAGGKSDWTTYEAKADRWPCYHPWFTLGIAVDGRVTLCCADYKFDLETGNIKNNTISEIWQSMIIKKMRKEHLKNDFKICNICKHCDIWQFHPDIFFFLQKKHELNKKNEYC